ncbi:MAG: hypothetical protein D6814_02170 [Calditrichaeota bacterium]|nr:MAG: hypothetical protein D6814_02170 [Calditrichota bacterium]
MWLAIYYFYKSLSSSREAFENSNVVKAVEGLYPVGTASHPEKNPAQHQGFSDGPRQTSGEKVPTY